MKMRNQMVALGLMILFGIGCDTVPYNEAVENQVPPPSNNPTDSTQNDSTQNDSTAVVLARKTVLLEDYTGHTCGNCPGAAREAHRIAKKYPGRVVIMGVHVGFFAFPKNFANGSFREDFRTPAGNALDDRYKVSSAGLPKGIVNRKRFGTSGVSILPLTDWESRIAPILNEEPIGINLRLSPTFSPGSRAVSVKADAIFQKAYSQNLKMAMYITEDSIINWQKEYDTRFPPENQPDYVHMHVLRTDLSPSSGTDVLNTQPVAQGRTFTTTWTTSLNAKVKEKHANVVFVVYRADNDEVIQVVERKLTGE